MSREHDELPLPDFDHVLVGHLSSRIASLEQADVQKLLDYEKAHARRMPIQLVLQRRIDALKSGAATPTEGGGGDASGTVGNVGGGPKVTGTSRKAGGASRSTLKVNPGGR
jgi:hypothetical protein